MSGTRGGRGVGWFPGRGVVNYQGGYLVVTPGKVPGWHFSIQVWEMLLRFEGLAMVGLCLVVALVGGAVGRVEAREAFQYE